jgi:hypothetical protein
MSFSSRTLLHKCPRKYKLQATHGSKLVRPAVELGVGFHKLMELSMTGPPEDLFSGYDQWIKDRKKAFANRTVAEEDDKIDLAYAKAQSLFLGYLDAQRCLTLRPELREFVCSEYRFDMDLGDVLVPGVIDFIAVTEDDTLVVGDYKTTGIAADIYRSYLLKSHQGVLYYHWTQSQAFAEAFPEVHAKYGKPTGVVYEIISTPAIRQKKNETFEDFLLRYREVMSTEPEDYILRNKFVPDAATIADTLAAFKQSGEFYASCVKTGYWARNDCNCLNNGKLCEFIEECAISTAMPDKSNTLVQISAEAEVEEDE